jgi:hypothetical protein
VDGGYAVRVRLAVIAASATIVLAALLIPAGASAASPVLEFVPHGASLPVSFTTEGGPVIAELAGFSKVVHCTGSAGQGEITGARTAVAKYEFTGCVAQTGSMLEAKCKSEGAPNPEEIRTGSIAAELVYLDQAKREVGILLNPGGGIYMTFECGGESTEARGPFLSSVTPVDEAASSFTATLTESNALQTPDEYENAGGEKLKATPEGNREGAGWVTTGVASAITVHPSTPIEIRAITAVEVEAKQHEAEARQRDEEAKAAAAAAAKKQQEEAAARKRHEEEVAAANKKRAEEEALAALKSALRSALSASGKAPKVGALLKHGGLTLAFSSSEPGTLVIEWWQVPPGAHLAKKGKLKPVLVAQGEAIFARPGAGKVKIGLTRAGRRLLAGASRLKLTSRARFTPTGQSAIGASSALTLKR